MAKIRTGRAVPTIYGIYDRESRPRLALTYDYETSAIQSFRANVGLLNADLILDIGANIGVYSIFCADLPAVAEVHAFEPAPESFRALSENVPLNEIAATKTTCHNIALSDSVGNVKFNLVSAMSGANAIVPTDKAVRGEVIEVSATTLDRMFDYRGRVAAIKIDVEGHELAVINGMLEFLSNNDCYIQVEALAAEKKADIHNILCRMGFIKIFRLRDDLIYVSRGLDHFSERVREVMFESLDKDLSDLLTLRRSKRSWARTALQLWQSVDYQIDPLTGHQTPAFVKR